MADSTPKKDLKKPCSVQGCPGQYEERLIVHATHKEGCVVVINDVPAEVCDLCVDTLYTVETSERITDILRALGRGELEPADAAPVYSFAA